jgi:hypothetical protein
MARGYWDIGHFDVPDQEQHQTPDQFDVVRKFCKEGSWEPYAVMPVFGPEGPGGVTKPMMRHWLKRWIEA